MEGMMASRMAKARVAGAVYITASLVGFIRLMYVPSMLFVHGNASATVQNLLAHETLFRWTIASEPIAWALWLLVPLALYRLLDDVDHTLAVLMVILGAFIQVPLGVINTATDAAALMLARGADFLSVVDKPQRDAYAMFFLNLHHQIDLANLVFAGLWLVPFGLLVYKSRFLPRFIGIWLVLECVGWLAFSVTGFVSPANEDKVFGYAQPLFLAEVAIMLWLTIFGARPGSAIIGRRPSGLSEAAT
jgi:hypothetical protein